jgi:hypothetical protein
MIGQPDFPRMVWSVYYFLFHVFIEEVTVPASHKVLVEVNDNNIAIDNDLVQILDQQDKSHPIFFLLLLLFY